MNFTWIATAAMLTAQPGVSEALEEWDGIKTRHEAWMDSLFACYDTEYKRILKENLLSADSDTLILGVERGCQAVYDRALEIYLGTSLEATGSDLISKTRREFGETYKKHIDDFLLKPEVADSRAKAASMALGLCIREKVKRWASQDSSAEVVAQASVRSCSGEWDDWRTTMKYKLKAEGSAVGVSKLEAGVRDSIAEQAIVWVFEAREGGR